MKCQVCLLPPVGACTAISRHSRNRSGSTGREKSSRLRTERVVASSSSGVRLSEAMWFSPVCMMHFDTGMMHFDARAGASPARTLYEGPRGRTGYERGLAPALVSLHGDVG